MNKFKFIKNVEKMIDPINIGTTHFLQTYSKILPKPLQYKIIKKSSEQNPYMGFVVEPYSFFLCYELRDLDWAESLLPDNFKLIKTSIFKDDDPKYYCIFGVFNVHTSAFWGTRMEFYIITENKTTGLLSWVIIDYDTNTISYDEKNGLSDANTTTCVFTTAYDGEVIVDIQNERNNRELVTNGKISSGQFNKLSSRLWLEGNLSVGYGKELTNRGDDVFALIFHPSEVEQALKLPTEVVNIQKNTWYPGLFEHEPSQIVCFPYAQHFLSDSPGHVSEISSEIELLKQYNEIDFNTFSKYSGNSIKKAFLIGQLISTLIILVLIAALIFK
ncbi:hypothetical protein VNN36_12420 (plasmid) [Lactococcus garvieae]|uniref:hypothetical protein n=1 Tax=Lactococcus garvieae TaxID=1363 RepID=UPI0030D35FCC